jgi:hypothetical protein
MELHEIPFVGSRGTNGWTERNGEADGHIFVRCLLGLGGGGVYTDKKRTFEVLTAVSTKMASKKRTVANQSASCERTYLLKAHQHCKILECHKGGCGSGGTMDQAKAGVGYNKQGLWLTPARCNGPPHHHLSSEPPHFFIYGGIFMLCTRYCQCDEGRDI